VVPRSAFFTSRPCYVVLTTTTLLRRCFDSLSPSSKLFCDASFPSMKGLLFAQQQISPLGDLARRLVDDSMMGEMPTLLLVLRKLATNLGLDNGALMTGGSPEAFGRTFQCQHGLIVLCAVLKQWRVARMSFPSPEGAERLAQLGRASCEKREYSCPGDFIGFLDGTIKDRERPCDDVWQKANYNGKTKSHAYKVLLVQLFDGCFAHCVVNFLGSVGDGRLCYYLDVEQGMSHLPANFKIAGDTAFATSPRVVRPLPSSCFSPSSLSLLLFLSFFPLSLLCFSFFPPSLLFLSFPIPHSNSSPQMETDQELERRRRYIVQMMKVHYGSLRFGSQHSFSLVKKTQDNNDNKQEEEQRRKSRSEIKEPGKLQKI